VKGETREKRGGDMLLSGRRSAAHKYAVESVNPVRYEEVFYTTVTSFIIELVLKREFLFKYFFQYL